MDSEKRHPAPLGFDWGSLHLFLLVLCAVVLCVWIVWPFQPALTGAIVLAVVMRRPVRWLHGRIGSPALAAAVALLVFFAIVVTPTLIVAYNVGQHVLDMSRALEAGSLENEVHQILDQHPGIMALARRLAENADPGQALAKAAGAAATQLAVLLGLSFSALLQIIVMLFVLFFLFRDADEGPRLLRSLLALDSGEAEYLLRRATRATEALVLGRFVTAAVQGVAAGLAFLALGVGGAELLGFLSMIFALIPVAGAGVVWIPVTIFLAITHHWIKAIILLTVGSLIISTLDNVLYPILVGSRLRLHTVPVFLAMIGGVWLFGVSGLLLGPIIFNLTVSLLAIWRSRNRGEPLPPD